MNIDVAKIQRRIDTEQGFLNYDEARALKVFNDGRVTHRVECGLTHCACGCGTLILDTKRFVVGHHCRKNVLISLNKYEKMKKVDVRKNTQQIIQDYKHGVWIDQLALKYGGSYPLIKDILLENRITLKRKPRQPLSHAQKENVSQGMNQYFTLKKRGIATERKHWVKKEEKQSDEICVEGVLQSVDKIISSLALPEEFLEQTTNRVEVPLHKVIRLWCVTQQIEDLDLDIEFFHKVKAYHAPRRPVDVLIEKENNGGSIAYEIEIFDKDEISLLSNLFEKRRFFGNLTVVIPQNIFIPPKNIEKIKRLPELLGAYSINFLVSPFSPNPQDFPREIYEMVSFSI